MNLIQKIRRWYNRKRVDFRDQPMAFFQTPDAEVLTAASWHPRRLPTRRGHRYAQSPFRTEVDPHSITAREKISFLLLDLKITIHLLRPFLLRKNFPREIPESGGLADGIVSYGFVLLCYWNERSQRGNVFRKVESHQFRSSFESCMLPYQWNNRAQRRT